MFRAAAISDGIASAGEGIPKELEDEAMFFVHEYCLTHLYFNGGSVLEAWRRRIGNEASDMNWRNRWGAIITKARNEGWIFKVGREHPTAVQSHTLSLVRWQSMIYEGSDGVVPQGYDRVKEIRKQFYCREIDLWDALWAAYEFGIENGK